MSSIPFQTIDWSSVEKIRHQGESGAAFWQTVEFSGLRIRLVTYAKGYEADHWCRKGHIVYCLRGEFISELNSGEKVSLSAGQMYVVSDDLSAHRSRTENGAELLIIDGDFLKHT